MKHNSISVLIKYRHSACYNKYINVFLKFERRLLCDWYVVRIRTS